MPLIHTSPDFRPSPLASDERRVRIAWDDYRKLSPRQREWLDLTAWEYRRDANALGGLGTSGPSRGDIEDRMKTANTVALYCELPADLARALDEWRAAREIGKTAAVVQAIEKLLGRKPTKPVERRGRPRTRKPANVNPPSS